MLTNEEINAIIDLLDVAVKKGAYDITQAGNAYILARKLLDLREQPPETTE